jgi:leucyl aminopeptidase (aminopeptidase T)
MDRSIIKTIIKKCLGYKSGEEVLIICDDKLCELAYDFYKIANSLGIKTTYFLMKPAKMHGQEPPKVVAEALNKADIAILLTSMSLSHTQARKTSSHKYGTRIASLPGVTAQILKRAIPINYSSLDKKVSLVSNRLTKAQKIEIYTKKGTHLIMSVKGREGFSDNGLYLKRGAFGNLPAGEACIGPCERTTNGVLVIDGSAPFVGRIKKPIKISIKNGYAKNIPIPKIAALVKSLGKNALNVAELGIGLNLKAKVTGNVLEDEKAKNTAHIAFGNNKSFGGKVYCPCHLDFVFFNPIILLDGVRLKI